MSADQNALEAAAATAIQKTYRGHRTRNQLRGYNLDASTRWTDAVQEARFRKLIRPRGNRSSSEHDGGEDSTQHSRDGRQSQTFAREEWRRLAKIASRAHQDDTSESDGEDGMTADDVDAYRRRKAAAKHLREVDATIMGLQYFLELIDEKHRYGSHLRAYHAAWMKTDTRQNFFYWLDYGEGRDVEVPECSRERLEKDQVRYLSREERYKYLVKIDANGRLRWAKNGQLITTNYQFKDSIEGIVHSTDRTPAFREEVHGARHEQQDPETDSRLNSFSSSSTDSAKEGQHYINRDIEEAKGIKKIQYVSAAAVLNHLLQSTTKKNTWIFVADTSFRLYIGIKQSGSFQHSSFLHGSRVSAAGLIKIKNGQLRSLSPLSGHYRPPVKNFRAFVHSLKDAGCDMSHVNISKAYAILLGLEGYLKTKSRAKSGLTKFEHNVEKVFKPEEAKERAERETDKSESARKEREWLEKERVQQREARRQKGWKRRLSEKLHLTRSTS